MRHRAAGEDAVAAALSPVAERNADQAGLLKVIDMKKSVPLICGIGGIIIGLTIIVLSIIDAEISKPLRLLFSFFCFANAIVNFRNAKGKK